MAESLASRFLRWKFNFFPAYRGTGAWVTYIADDFREVRVRLPLSWRTRNLVGTIFGGSLYGSVDPIYMIMLIRLLGREFIVWDKAAEIRFRKPGRSTLFASFTIDESELNAIRESLAPAQWRDTALQVAHGQDSHWMEVLTSRPLDAREGRLPLAEVLEMLPVALLLRTA